jgi:hypothetical protein
MNLTNATKFPAAYTMGLEPSGRELLVVVIKATFTIPEDGSDPVPAKQQIPLVEADVFAGEPGLSAPLVECDYAARKPKCDVILNGSAYAPGGKPAESVPVLLQVGALSKSFNVVGNRAWVKDVFAWRATRPVPFVKMPISYGNAFGGRDLSDPDEKNHHWYGPNHAGVGFHSNLYPPLVEGRPLPSTEEIGKPVEKPDGKYRPMAFGPIGRAWEPRYKLAGTYDQKWLDDVCPFLPSDFKDEYYQCAPADQQIPPLKGGEEVVLVNLTPSGRTSFRMPPLSMPVTLFSREGVATEREGTADTILIEPEQGRFSIVWRVTEPLKRNLLELGGALVGQMSRGWRLAKELGKEYCPSLTDAIAYPRRGSRKLPAPVPLVVEAPPEDEEPGDIAEPGGSSTGDGS